MIFKDAYPEGYLSSLANNLLSRITASLLKVNTINRSINEASQKVDVVKNSMNFNIRENPKIVQLQVRIYLE
jgi:hypothetical protein